MVPNREDSEKDLAQRTRQSLQRLTARKQLILRPKYGLGVESEHTDEQIAASLGISPDKVREEEAQALRELGSASQPGADDLGAQIEEVPDLESDIQLAEVIESIRELTPDLIRHLREQGDDLAKIDPHVAEHLVGELLAQRGFDQVQLLGRDTRTSADVFASYFIHATDSRIRYFVEVKRTQEKIGIEVINSVHGAMLIEEPEFGWHAAMIVSLAGLKDLKKITYEQLALRRVELRDKEDLIRWLGDYEPNAGGLWVPKPDAGVA